MKMKRTSHDRWEHSGGVVVQRHRAEYTAAHREGGPVLRARSWTGAMHNAERLLRDRRPA